MWLMFLENWILILQVHSCLVEPSTARHEAHRGDSGFAEANAGLQPAVLPKPDRDNDTSVIRGPVIRKAGWPNSNGAVQHTAACEKSYISGVLRKRIEKKRRQPTHYFLRKAKGLAKPSMVLAEQLDTCDKICVIRYDSNPTFRKQRAVSREIRHRWVLTDNP